MHQAVFNLMTVVPFFRRGGLPRSGGPEWQAATNQSLSKHFDNDLLLRINMNPLKKGLSREEDRFMLGCGLRHTPT